MKKIIFIVLAMVIAIYLLYLVYEKRPSPKLEENEGPPSENWKEYKSMVEIWPRLKKEKTESIRFCHAISLEYGYDSESDFWANAEPSAFRVRDAKVVRWWPSIYKVPEENLPKCIKIINKAIKNAQEPCWPVSRLVKMLIVTNKGNYIFRVETDISEVAGPKVYGEEWMSDELGKFIMKYCIPAYEHDYFVPPKEQTVTILIFSDRKIESRHDSELVWPPVALFGDKKKAEKLLGRSFEPKKLFEGREWLEKIIIAYEIALKDAKETHYRSNDSSTLKGWIVFLTQDEFYWKGIGIDEDTVIGEYIKSEQLKKYFDELGLTKELLAGEPNKTAQ